MDARSSWFRDASAPFSGAPEPAPRGNYSCKCSGAPSPKLIVDNWSCKLLEISAITFFFSDVAVGTSRTPEGGCPPTQRWLVLTRVWPTRPHSVCSCTAFPRPRGRAFSTLPCPWSTRLASRHLHPVRTFGDRNSTRSRRDPQRPRLLLPISEPICVSRRSSSRLRQLARSCAVESRRVSCECPVV